MQLRHTEAPAYGWKLTPSRHGMHDDPPLAGCCVPASHCRQKFWTDAGWYQPGAQAVHVLWPGLGWMYPEGQGAHAG